MSDFTKRDFVDFWPKGYLDPADCPASERIIARWITPFRHPGHDSLEIGPGGGFWSRHIIGGFRRSHFVDAISLAQNQNFTALCGGIPGYAGINYIELDDGGAYSLRGIGDEAVDYVFSYAVFCHLSYRACVEYLSSVRRCARPGANIVIMFGCWERYPYYRDVPDKGRYLNSVHPGGWFYQNPAIATKALEEAGLSVVDADLMPQHRDCITHSVRR